MKISDGKWPSTDSLSQNERHNETIYNSYMSIKSHLDIDQFEHVRLSNVNSSLVVPSEGGYFNVMKSLILNRFFVLALSLFLFKSASLASSGTEGAAFLDIPVGGAPAAMGAAYTAQATDVYAPTWNPGGLGFAEGTQLSGMYLSYLESIQYQYMSFTHRLNKENGIGFSVQNLTSGDIGATDQTGASIGTFNVRYTAYNLAYGHAFNDKLSLGVTGKVIQARLSDVSANAYAGDVGAIYKANDRLTLGLTVANVGTKLKFIFQWPFARAPASCSCRA